MFLTTTHKNRHDHYDDLIDNVFNRLFDSSLTTSKLSGSSLVDICEDDKQYKIIADLPGYEHKDISIEQKNNYLHISAEKVIDNEETNQKWYKRERKSSQFSRSFLLPENVDDQNITASLDKGILTVGIPKKEKNLNKDVKRITIN
jgi:HSP20 family protein